MGQGPADEATLIALDATDSTSTRATPPFRAGAPNVVVVLDDTDFAQLGCYGGQPGDVRGRLEGDSDCMDLVCVADGRQVGAARLPHEWRGLWTPNSSASLLTGVGRPLPVCNGYNPEVGFTGTLDRLVVAADGGAGLLELDHQVDTAFRSQ